MKNITIDSYKLEKISSRMAKELGTIPGGQEEFYSLMLQPMESNLLKLHRQNPNRNGRRALEAIQMSLLTVDGYIREIVYDYARFTNPENQALQQCLLMSFDPYTNPDIYEGVIKNNSTFNAREYFKLPVKCLLRIEKSVHLWTKEWGYNGYFIFIEQELGYLVEQDDNMEFCIQMKADEAKNLCI